MRLLLTNQKSKTRLARRKTERWMMVVDHLIHQLIWTRIMDLFQKPQTATMRVKMIQAEVLGTVLSLGLVILRSLFQILMEKILSSLMTRIGQVHLTLTMMWTQSGVLMHQKARLVHIIHSVYSIITSEYIHPHSSELRIIVLSFSGWRLLWIWWRFWWKLSESRFSNFKKFRRSEKEHICI